MHVARLSVCLSVTLVDQDHIGWKSWKLIARTINPTPSLFVAQRPSTYSQKNMRKFGGDYRWGGKKWRAGAQKRQYLRSLKRIKIEEKLLRRAYGKSQTLFRTVPSPTPYGLRFPKIGVRNPTPKLQSLLSHKRLKLRTDCKNLADTFTARFHTNTRP